MRLYEGTIKEFGTHVLRNEIADIVKQKYENHYQRKVNDSEYRAWQQSLNILNNSFIYSSLTDNKIIVEYELPYSTRRIDVLLFGSDLSKKDNVVLIELKQWSNDHVADCETDGNVVVNYGKFRNEQAHPSLQVQGYHFDLADFFTVFQDRNSIGLDSCSYCHNYSRVDSPNVLFQPKFERIINTFPIFAKEDVESLGNYLKERLSAGNGLAVFNRFITSPIRPSKKLLEHAQEMINTQQVFNLIDDQIAAYNAIMHRAKNLAKTGRKSVIIVKGGPGTGKSVIALEVMCELMRQGKTVFHATGSSAFTNTLRKILGRRVKDLFKFFFNFTRHKENEIDVLICDEAHRIRQDSNDFRVPAKFKSRNPQVEDLIKPAKLTIFFIDEHQIVRPKEMGSIALIKATAKNLGVESNDFAEFELKTQFRCSGSDSYLQWLDKILEIRDIEINNFDAKMEFKIFDSPIELKQAINRKNDEKKNSARLVAGFCWPWSEPRPDGSLVNDVVIGDFAMPWEKKDEFWKWATDDTGMEQVGTVYTAQGFEFDYIGIIFGNDLTYDGKIKNWIGHPDRSYDTQVTRGNSNLSEHLKSTYRVLFSRAHKGVYVYFMDKETEEYFRESLKMVQIPIKKQALQILLSISEKQKYDDCLPVYSLKAAAGKFGDGEEVEEEGWVKVDNKKLDANMFVAKVVGHSMEPRIPNNSYGIFRKYTGGTRQGLIVLAQHHEIHDPDTGGSYTVKRYQSEKKIYPDGKWEHEIITLEPLNKEYKPIVLKASSESEVKVIAEFIDIL